MKKVTLLTRNAKLKKSAVKTFNFGIPACKSQTGRATCPSAGACKIGCYATQGWYNASRVQNQLEGRLALSLSSGFVPAMIYEIRRVGAERVRIHDAGDFYSDAYLAKWLGIIMACGDVEFYSYTKEVAMLKAIEPIDNFTVVYSYGGKQDKAINPNRDRHSRVFSSLIELQAHGYADASENDDVALEANPKIGLIYHGQRKYSNTHWSRVPH